MPLDLSGPEASWGNVAGGLLRCAVFLACLPTFLGWVLTSLSGPGNSSVAIYLAVLVAGWWGWFALFWLLVMLDRQTTSVPWYVVVGVFGGCAAIAVLFSHGIPWTTSLRAVVIWMLLFGGMPLVTVAGCALLILFNRWSIRRNEVGVK